MPSCPIHVSFLLPVLLFFLNEINGNGNGNGKNHAVCIDATILDQLIHSALLECSSSLKEILSDRHRDHFEHLP